MVRSANRSSHCASGIAFASFQLHIFFRLILKMN